MEDLTVPAADVAVMEERRLCGPAASSVVAADKTSFPRDSSCLQEMLLLRTAVTHSSVDLASGAGLTAAAVAPEKKAATREAAAAATATSSEAQPDAQGSTSPAALVLVDGTSDDRCCDAVDAADLCKGHGATEICCFSRERSDGKTTKGTVGSAPRGEVSIATAAAAAAGVSVPAGGRARAVSG